MLIPIGSNEPVENTWATLAIMAVCICLQFFASVDQTAEKKITGFCGTSLQQEISEPLHLNCEQTMVAILSGKASNLVDRTKLPSDEKEELQKSIQIARKRLDIWKWKAFNPNNFSFVSLVTSAFFHGGWMHLIGNMIFLFIFGRLLEVELGGARLLAIFIGANVFADLLYALLAWTGLISGLPTLGASAGLYGIMAGVWRKMPRVKIDCIFFFFSMKMIQIPATYLIAFYVVGDIFSLLTSGMSDVNFVGHLAGFAIVYFLVEAAPVRKDPFADV